MAQSASPKSAGTRIPRREELLRSCGITHTDPNSALALSHSPGATWKNVNGHDAPTRRADSGSDYDATALVFHEDGPWFVQYQQGGSKGEPQVGKTRGFWMHWVGLCAEKGGEVTRLIDVYMDGETMVRRVTDTKFAGRSTPATETWYEGKSGEMDAPQGHDSFPPALMFRNLKELPFFELIKPHDNK